jgi:hypothetical protein
MIRKLAGRSGETRIFKLKRPYRVPRLTEYGRIAKLTTGTTGSHQDKGHLANAHGNG